jgi:hypothetical protein
MAFDDGHALAHLCDNASLSEWFRGRVQGDEAALRSDSGAELRVSLTDRTEGGILRLSDGRTLPVQTRVQTRRRPGAVADRPMTSRFETVRYVGGSVLLSERDYD